MLVADASTSTPSNPLLWQQGGVHWESAPLNNPKKLPYIQYLMLVLLSSLSAVSAFERPILAILISLQRL